MFPNFLSDTSRVKLLLDTEDFRTDEADKKKKTFLLSAYEIHHPAWFLDEKVVPRLVSTLLEDSS